jgi:uncharacterized protein involved in exopolysaccharide biosynthesis
LTLGLIGCAVGVIYAVLAKPIYRAVAIVAPTTSDGGGDGLAKLAGQFSGLAAIAGIGNMSGNDQERSFAVLTSGELIATFVEEKGILPKLFPKRWDAKDKKWLESKGGQPSRWEIIKEFDENVRSITRDTRTGIITVGMEAHDPTDAAEWANSYVDVANRVLRAKAIEEASASLEYLYAQLDSTAVMESREMLYRLIEAQMGKLTIAETKPDFAFEVVDAAVEPDLKSFVRPRRVAAVIIGAVTGLLIGILHAVLRDAMRASSSWPLRTDPKTKALQAV